jgi:hypothetical protein
MQHLFSDILVASRSLYAPFAFLSIRRERFFRRVASGIQARHDRDEKTEMVHNKHGALTRIK